MMHVDSNNAYWNYMGGHCNSQLVVPKMKLGRVLRTRSNGPISMVPDGDLLVVYFQMVHLLGVVLH